MTMHSPTDVRVISVHTDNGGCGVPHELAADHRLDCPPCEQWLQRTPSLGWSNHPGGVALTCDEKLANERAEKKAQQAGWNNLAGQVAGAASGLVPAGQQLSLVEQIARMSPEERGALLMLLSGGTVPAIEAAPSVPVVDAVPVEPVGAAPEQPKRASRPRKATAAAAA